MSGDAVSKTAPELAGQAGPTPAPPAPTPALPVSAVHLTRLQPCSPATSMGERNKTVAMPQRRHVVAT